MLIKGALASQGRQSHPGTGPPGTSASDRLAVHQFHHQPSLQGSRATFSIKGLKKGHWVVVPILLLGLIFRALSSVSSVSETAVSTQTYCVTIKYHKLLLLGKVGLAVSHHAGAVSHLPLRE